MGKEFFSGMSLEAQIEYLYINGSHIGSKPYLNYWISLYSVEKEYYKVWYDNDSADIIRITQISKEEANKLYSGKK
jgi:hypothetical protein